MSQQQLPKDITAAIAPKLDRVVHVFDIPPKYQTDNGITSFGLVELTAKEDLKAKRRYKGDIFKLQDELIKMSFYEFNDKKISPAEPHRIESFWNNMPNRLRTMVIACYQKINEPDEEDLESFLGSGRQKT